MHQHPGIPTELQSKIEKAAEALIEDEIVKIKKVFDKTFYFIKTI